MWVDCGSTILKMHPLGNLSVTKLIILVSNSYINIYVDNESCILQIPPPGRLVSLDLGAGLEFLGR